MRCSETPRRRRRALALAASLALPGTLFAAARGEGPPLVAPAGELAASASRIVLRLDPLADLYFSVRAQAAREGEPPLPGHEAAVAAARTIQAALGAFGGWGPLDSEVITAGDPATLARRFAALPESLERGGRAVALRDDAAVWARELAALYPEFVERTWPARRQALAAIVAGLERDLLPRHPQAIAHLLSWLGIAEPAIEVPVVLVTEIHPPGATTYRIEHDAPAAVVAAPPLAAHGQLVETILHEVTHSLDIASRGQGSAFGALRALLAERGLTARDRLFHDVPHTLMFVQAAETVRRIYDPVHVPYGESSGLYERLGQVAEVERRIWPQVLDGALRREEALRRIVDELVPLPNAPGE